ncbi:amidase signature enzyme [Mytilinidion resinicola]|uniref:Amidase signature enzyme n=1 Tax=Mytilinidion resinicola TaxID=574789 RepID=A0A6A6YFQ4_9PEZI|nr:amidase signature enzyme [Mytilinidion resinicola]KAF2806717.1 amidase signature enzyme [Mytilinidion resinicola]
MDHDIDVLRATAADLAALLNDGKTTSVEIVEAYLQQIAKHNHAGPKLHAIVSVPAIHQLHRVAKALDDERTRGHVRGPLHGVPIIVKASTDIPGCVQYADAEHADDIRSFAFAESKARVNAGLVDVLITQGLIALGKANLTAPGGSSTGSAVGVAAGFSPISLGTETSGSLTTPASRAALYALKLTPGSVCMDGVWQVAASFDSAGGMAKSVLDLALLSTVLLQQKDPGRPSLVDAMQEDWKGISVGFVDIELWRLPDDGHGHAREYQDAIDQLRESGANVVHLVCITPPEQWRVEGGTRDVDDLMRSQTRAGYEFYLRSFEDPKVRSLQDTIAFNAANPETEFDEVFCPNQNGLLKAQDMSMSDEETQKNLQICKQWAATEGVDKVVAEHGVDAIVAPCDSFFAGVGVGARYPLASIPFGYVESSGRPCGLHVIAKANEEDKIVRFMSVWERMRPPRTVSDLDSLARALRA